MSRRTMAQKRSFQTWASIWKSEVSSLKRASNQELPRTLNSFEMFDEFIQELHQYCEDSNDIMQVNEFQCYPPYSSDLANEYNVLSH